MNNTQLHIQHQQFSLKRFPANQFDKSLRAWDAADEYIIDHVAENISLNELGHIVIINDSFGALTCAMAKLAPQAEITVYTDSYMAKRGIIQNLKGSNLDKNKVNIQSVLMLSDSQNKAPIDLILLKVPRTIAYLDYLLLTLSTIFDSKQNQGHQPIFVGGAMVKLVTSSVMKSFDTRARNTKTSLARKKARLIFADLASQNLNSHTTSPDEYVLKVNDSEIPFTLYNYPNVFCREQVDIGARYMLKVLPKITKESQVVVDLGCGNGILGTSILLANKHKSPKLIFVDESYMAIASAKATLANSEVSEQNKNNARFIVGHCLEELIENLASSEARQGADYVICNPPFHQQSAVIDDIAWQMFVDAKKILKPGGELRIVGNRHLDHRAKLSKLFGGCVVVASDKKFVVLSAIKQQ